MKIIEKEKSKRELTATEILSLKLYRNILKSAYNALWTLQLFKTSLLITKTPLTTLKSILKGNFCRNRCF
ncbi:MAG: hypothetical protein ACPL0C_06640 [Candidatus Bathyarchaeales archaeon]